MKISVIRESSEVTYLVPLLEVVVLQHQVAAAPVIDTEPSATPHRILVLPPVAHL